MVASDQQDSQQDIGQLDTSRITITVDNNAG